MNFGRYKNNKFIHSWVFKHRLGNIKMSAMWRLELARVQRDVLPHLLIKNEMFAAHTPCRKRCMHLSFPLLTQGRYALATVFEQP